MALVVECVTPIGVYPVVGHINTRLIVLPGVQLTQARIYVQKVKREYHNLPTATMTTDAFTS